MLISLKFGKSNVLVFRCFIMWITDANSCYIWKRSIHNQCFNHFTNNWTELMNWSETLKHAPNKFQKQCRNKPTKATLHLHHHTKIIFVHCYAVFVHLALYYATKYHWIVLSMFQSVLFLLSVMQCSMFSISLNLHSIFNCC